MMYPVCQKATHTHTSHCALAEYTHVFSDNICYAYIFIHLSNNDAVALVLSLFPTLCMNSVCAFMHLALAVDKMV